MDLLYKHIGSASGATQSEVEEWEVKERILGNADFRNIIDEFAYDFTNTKATQYTRDWKTKVTEFTFPATGELYGVVGNCILWWTNYDLYIYDKNFNLILTKKITCPTFVYSTGDFAYLEKTMHGRLVGNRFYYIWGTTRGTYTNVSYIDTEGNNVNVYTAEPIESINYGISQIDIIGDVLYLRRSTYLEKYSLSERKRLAYVSTGTDFPFIATAKKIIIDTKVYDSDLKLINTLSCPIKPEFLFKKGAESIIINSYNMNSVATFLKINKNGVVDFMSTIGINGSYMDAIVYSWNKNLIKLKGDSSNKSIYLGRRA